MNLVDMEVMHLEGAILDCPVLDRPLGCDDSGRVVGVIHLGVLPIDDDERTSPHPPAGPQTTMSKRHPDHRRTGWRTVRYHAYPIVKLGIAGAGDANRTRDPNLGKVMLYP